MVLFVGVTVLVLLMAYFCNTEESVQLHMDRAEAGGCRIPKPWGQILRQRRHDPAAGAEFMDLRRDLCDPGGAVRLPDCQRQ